MKSILLPARLKAFRQSGAVYVVCCFEEEYYCDGHQDGQCRRGFFSLYLQAVYGIHFAKNLSIPYHVDFGNLKYSYSDPDGSGGKGNFWTYFFHQPPLSSNSVKIQNTRFENFPLKIWDRAWIGRLHREAVKDIILQEDLRKALKEIRKQFQGVKVLGIHIRKTDHSDEVTPAKDEVYFRLLSRQIKDFDKLFVATDDADIMQALILRYPDKVFCHAAVRSRGTAPIHGNPGFGNGPALGKEALLDCYSLSFCNRVILSPSNLSYCALLLNPDLPYQLAESPNAKIKRWKTLSAYYLDKWGLRKW